MNALTALLPLVLAAPAAADPAPPPGPGEAARLVARLGDPDYREREAATRRLEELGSAAMNDLRAACRSDNPETARRALDLFRKAEWKAASEKALSPTLVELGAKDQPLDAVLAELSKQARCDVVLGGPKPDDLAVRKVTVSTGGEVPFWEAVRAVCGAADLRVAVVGGFLAPDAAPYLGRAGRGVRVAADPRRAVVLEARGDAGRRPAAVYGAVLVEAFPLSWADAQPAALLQAWPEPRLAWEGATEAKVVRAAGAGGDRLAADFAPAGTGATAGGDGTVLVRNPDGSATLVRDPGAVFQLSNTFRPNARQAVVRFKPPGMGTAAPREAKELAVSLLGTVRTGVEPLCRVAGLEADKTGSAAGPGGLEVSVRYTADRGKFVAAVELSYDPRAVNPAGVGDDLPGTRGGPVGFGNHTVHGARITDADGKPYVLGLSVGANQFDPTGRRVVIKLTLELHPGRYDIGPPAVATFWGTAARPVEVPVVLRDVPLTGGK